MNMLEHFNAMREVLVPRGTAPLVHLHIGNAGYVDYSLIEACMDDMEKRGPLVMAGIDDLSPLERLALLVLYYSAEQRGVTG